MARRRRRRLGHTPVAGCEPLEKRHALTAGFVGANWTIFGTDSDDTILIDRDPARPGTLQATVNGVVVGTRPEARVRLLRIHGLAGNDLITVDLPGNARLRTLVRGGEGDDTITTGDGDDLLFGGGGGDTLVGGRGRDFIRGDRGDDVLTGSLGDDALFGGRGRDTLRGGEGRNQLVGGADHDIVFGTAGIDTATLGPGEQLIGNESTNPLVEVSDIDTLRTWYVQTALAQFDGWFGRTVPSGPDGPVVLVDPVFGLPTVLNTSAAGDAAGDGARPPAGSGDFTGTNNQTAGVDEGDRFKTDGSHLFVLAGDGIDVITAWPAAALATVAHISTAGEERALFLSGDRLTVVSQEYQWANPALPIIVASGDGPAASSLVARCWYGFGQPQVVVTVVDVSNAAAPVVLETTRIDGTFIDGRDIDGRISIVTQADVDIPWPTLVPLDDGKAYETRDAYRARVEASWSADVLPAWSTAAGGTTTQGPLVVPGRTYVPVDPDTGTIFTISTFLVGDAVAGPDTATSVAGVAAELYASTGSLYVSATEVGNWWDASDSQTTTNIYRFDLEADGTRLVAMGAVPGTTLNQFSFDEDASGHLRVATTTWNAGGSGNHVFVLEADDGNLRTVGSVQDLAPGERIFSVRFVGDRGYVSTFLQIDPLFVIDLADPTAPTVRGELKVPGFSSYLQPLDATHLLGIGRDVDAETGTTLGLQLSIFDVSDAARPERTAVYTFAGDAWDSWSAAQWDHRAVSWFGERGVLALPIQEGGWSASSNSLSLFQVGIGTTDTIDRVADIMHETFVDRSLRIGNFVYSVAASDVQVHSFDDLGTLVARVPLTGSATEFQPTGTISSST
jgi:hypothetical protein